MVFPPCRTGCLVTYRRSRLIVAALLALAAALAFLASRAVLAPGRHVPLGTIAPAASDGTTGPVSRASAQITAVIPSPATQATIEATCEDGAMIGYVPIVQVDSSDMAVPEEGTFLHCPSGARVFLVPSGS